MRRIDFSLDRSKTAVQYNRQGVEAMLRGSYREASYYLLSAVVCDPDYWPAFFNLGNSWAKLDDSEAAIWAYEQAVRGSDDYAPLFLNLGLLYCRQDRYRDSIPYLEHAWHLAPDRPTYAVALGYACYKLEEFGLSWHWYRKALRLDSENERIRESMQLVGERILVTME